MFNLNAKGTVFSRSRSSRRWINQEDAVVLTTSTANVKGMPLLAGIWRAKAALRSFARVFAAELLPRGIRVNAVSPGPTETPIIGKTFPDKATADHLMAQMREAVPMKALRKGGGSRRGRPLPRIRRDLHDRLRTTVDGGWSQL